MLVEIGHAGSGQGPAVTYAHIPDEQYPFAPSGITPGDIALHFQRTPDGVTRLPGLEAFLVLAHPMGLMAGQGIDSPTWVRSSNSDLAALLGSYFDIPTEAPADLEDTHWTKHGTASYPPGAMPDPAGGITAMLTNAGRDIWAANLWSALGSATVVGATGTATATSSTSLTGGTESVGSHASNDAAGQILVCWGTGVYGIVVSNTSGTAPVYTVDRWYTPSTPGGAAAATPGSTTGYTLLAGGPPALFMAISANNATVLATDTNLPGEITTVGGGLIRKQATMGHTAGDNHVSVAATFTANGTDALSVIIAKVAIGPSMVSTYKNALQTLLLSTATLTTSGDQLTVTDTITGS